MAERLPLKVSVRTPYGEFLVLAGELVWGLAWAYPAWLSPSKLSGHCNTNL